MAINWDIIKGKWAQFQGEGRAQWGKLTDNDWEQIAGERDKLVGRLQESYGWTRENAEKEADTFFERTSERVHDPVRRA